MLHMRFLGTSLAVLWWGYQEAYLSSPHPHLDSSGG